MSRKEDTTLPLNDESGVLMKVVCSCKWHDRDGFGGGTKVVKEWGGGGGF